MRRPEQVLDMPNLGLDIGEYIQDIRDRGLKFLGISAVAGFLEDLAKPDYPSWVRARWARLNKFDADEEDFWQAVKPGSDAGRMPKHKQAAVVVAVDQLTFRDLEQEVKEQTFVGGISPIAAFNYRGISRVGLLPQRFGQIKDDVAVAMLIGRSQFDVSMGLAWVPSWKFAERRVRRSEIKEGTAFIPSGVHIFDRLQADDLHREYPGVPLV